MKPKILVCLGMLYISGIVGQTTTPTPTIPSTDMEDKCTFKKNSLGTCGDCGGQLFVNDDCTSAFFCMLPEELPEDAPADAEGCELVCEDDEILIADPREPTWFCQKRISPMPMICPGGFNTECACEGTEEQCPMAECECEGQISVNHDCTKAWLCDADLEHPDEKTCENGEIVYVDPRNNRWFCAQDDGRCPGAFHAGCNRATTTTTPPTTITPTTEITPTTTTSSDERKCKPMKENTLGTCDCKPQLHYGRDCRSAFYCMTDEMFEDGNPDGNVGCEMTCPEGKFLVPDPRAENGGKFFCIDNTNLAGVPLKCPGGYHTECPCGEDECPIGDCECNGQLRIRSDCKYARLCDGSDEGYGYTEYTCEEERKILWVDLATLEITCGNDDGRCPNTNLNVGCEIDTTPTTTTDDPTTSDPSVDPTDDTTVDPTDDPTTSDPSGVEYMGPKQSALFITAFIISFFI